MFGLSIVKTAELKAFQNTVAVLESDVVALNRKYNNLADHVERNNKEVNVQFASVGKALALLDSNAVLAKPKTCPVLQQTPKHVTDPVGAWESKQRVLEIRLKSASANVDLLDRQERLWCGDLVRRCASLKRKAQEQVEQIKKDVYEHSTRKPVVIQLPPPSETAVFVQHKKYGTLGLLKGNHITILNNGNNLDVGDVILNATPTVVHTFWDILPKIEQVTFSV